MKMNTYDRHYELLTTDLPGKKLVHRSPHSNSVWPRDLYDEIVLP